jgi:subtilisin-like proprotein convertase family protein
MMAVIRTDLTCKDATVTSAARALDRSSSRVKRVLAALAASVVALLSLAGSASAASFAANPGSLGSIPDGIGIAPSCTWGGSSRGVTFTVTGVSSPITNLAVSMTFTPPHTWVGDLAVGLIAPSSSASQEIFWRTGALYASDLGDDSNVAGPYTFSDTAPASPSWWQAAASTIGTTAIPSGSYRASYPGTTGAGSGANTLLTPTFASVPPNGTWHLTFWDHCQGDTGSVAAATLEVTGTSPPPAGPVTTPTSTSTGQRAAALKRCKKKKSATARRKCKKKANLLPV